MTNRTRIKILRAWLATKENLIKQSHSNVSGNYEELEKVLRLFTDNDYAVYSRVLYCPNWLDRMKGKYLYDEYGESRIKKLKSVILIPYYEARYLKYKLKVWLINRKDGVSKDEEDKK